VCVHVCVLRNQLETNYAFGILLNDNHYFITKTNTWGGGETKTTIILHHVACWYR
jgi:hypothetical protein